MSGKKALQEIYGEGDDDIEVTDKEVATAMSEIISELKEKYGDEWFKHIGEETQQED